MTDKATASAGNDDEVVLLGITYYDISKMEATAKALERYFARTRRVAYHIGSDGFVKLAAWDEDGNSYPLAQCNNIYDALVFALAMPVVGDAQAGDSLDMGGSDGQPNA